MLAPANRSGSVAVNYKTLLCLVLMLCAPRLLTAQAILHAFNWTYAEVAAKAPEIKALGYASVLVSPPLKSEGSAWWARYQPQDYRLIDSPLGNTEDFRAMAAQLSSNGLQLYADIVVNHMANEAGQRPDLNYPGQRVLDRYAANFAYYERQRLFGDLRENLLTAADFHEARCISDYNNVFQVQNWRLCGGAGDAGLPDLNDHNRVVAQQRAYLQALKDLGVSGFRIDAAKHMSPKQLARIFTPDIRAGVFVFGEVITGAGVGDTGYSLYLAPYLANTDHSAYDFPLHSALRRGFAFGGDLRVLNDPLSNGQALQSARAVTFTVTHDMPNNAIFRGQILDPVDETLAYAYVLGRQGGRPLLYSDHNESGDRRWQDAYKRPDLRAMLHFHNQTLGEDQYQLASAPCFLMFRRGAKGVVGINKCGSAVDIEINANFDKLSWYTTYRDVLSGAQIRIDRRDYRITIPARSARLWLRDDRKTAD